MHEADEHEAHVEPEAGVERRAASMHEATSTRPASSPRRLDGPGVGRDAPAPHVEPADLRGRARSWPRDLGGDFDARRSPRAASMHEAGEHEAHPPP
ncbi:hypothetical protein, partial [Polyangium spumosum]